MRLYLTGADRDRLGRMARKRRQHVSTGGRKGVTTAVATDADALRTFHALHLEHGRRHNYPVPGPAVLESLHREFGRADGLAIVTGFVKTELAGMLIGGRFGPISHNVYLPQ